MKTYRMHGLLDYWKLIHMDVRAASDKAAKVKFRKRVRGSVTGVAIDQVLP